MRKFFHSINSIRPGSAGNSSFLFSMIFTMLASTPAHAGMEVNLSGYENGGDKLNWDYVLPAEADLRYYASKGITTVRLPMNWNRLQPAVGGPLDEAKVSELTAFLDLADRTGVRVIADLHAFGGRDGAQLGSAKLPPAALAGFWSLFSLKYKGRFAGYDLMNEPHDMPSATAWPKAAQAAVNAIREHDRRTPIYVEGDDWSGAGSWQQVNGLLNIHDPADRIIYSAHTYFDANGSGTYQKPFDQDGATIAIGPARLKPFIDWLRVHGFKGHIGEFAVPFSDPRWLPVLDGFVAAVTVNKDVIVGAAYWAGGPWMDGYPLTIQPVKDGKWTDRPQMGVLTKAR